MSETLSRVVDLVQAGEVRVSAHGYDEISDDGILAGEVIAGIAAAVGCAMKSIRALFMALPLKPLSPISTYCSPATLQAGHAVVAVPGLPVLARATSAAVIRSESVRS